MYIASTQCWLPSGRSNVLLASFKWKVAKFGKQVQNRIAYSVLESVNSLFFAAWKVNYIEEGPRMTSRAR